MTNQLVAIHQPNFFPWLGYFDKIARCDKFIFLDHVQFQKTGGTWSNRVKLNSSGEGRWFTAPINRAFHGVARINEIEWANDQPWREKLIKTLVTNYSRSPHFREIMGILELLVYNSENNLARYNAHAILEIAQGLGLSTNKFRWSSDLGITSNSTELLIDLARAIGCDTYLCGGGADGYQQDSLFSKAGLKLVYQSFSHPIYLQRNNPEFIAGLSIIDALMECGFCGVSSWFNRTSDGLRMRP